MYVILVIVHNHSMVLILGTAPSPPVPQTSAPLSTLNQVIKLVGQDRIELSTSVLSGLHSTTELLASKFFI